MLVLEACGNLGSRRCTTNSTSTFLDRADPSSRASSTSFNASSCMAVDWDKARTWEHHDTGDTFLQTNNTLGFDLPGPRNWQPLARTAAHRLEESCWGFWCCRMSSVTVRSPSERAARMARTRPSSSTNWQCTRVTSFLCMGLLSMLCAALLNPTPKKQINPSWQVAWLEQCTPMDD